MKFLPPDAYQSRNATLFHNLQTRIRAALPHSRIEHVGASAVPGAYSKGDLDIFVGIPATEMETSISAIAGLGFSIKADTLRTPELCMLERIDDGTSVAIQLVGNGSKFEFFITFRDALIESPTLLARYNQLKESCTGMSEQDYRQRKTEFIEAALGGDR